MARDDAGYLDSRGCREPSYPCRPAMSETFHSFFKGLFIFRLRYLFAIGLGAIFSLRRNTPAFLCSSLKLHDSEGRKAWRALERRTDGTIALCGRSFGSRFIRLPEPCNPPFALQFRGFRFHPRTDSSIGFALFTRRYWGHHGCFLFLRLMICLSSAGFLMLQRSARRKRRVPLSSSLERDKRVLPI